MATLDRGNDLATHIGEMQFYGKDVTLLSIDFNVDADGSMKAVQAAHNAITRYGNIVMAGTIRGSGQLLDVIIEGAHTGSDYVSVDGTVTGTIGAALAEDLLNLGTVDGVNFATGTPAVTIRSTLALA